MNLLGPIQQIFDQAPVFALVLFRIGGLITLAPVLGSVSIPIKIKALLALVLSAAVFPMVPQATIIPNSLPGLAIGVGTEMLIGITMGFVLSLLFVGVQVGADLVGYQMGLGMARLVDPNTQIDTTVLSQFYVLIATLIYVLMDGHLIMIRSLVHTFQTIPLMGAGIGYDVLNLIVSIISNAFILGIRIAGPALVAIFLATIALGFVSRTMPQLNILAAGFPVRITLGLTLMITSFGAVGLLFQDSLIIVFRKIGEIFV